MKIYMYTSINQDLEQVFKEYSNAVNSVFDCEDEDFDAVMGKALAFKNELQNKLSKLTPANSFNEELYEQKIQDEETRSLLSNGLYNKKQLTELFGKCDDSLVAEIKKATDSCSDSDKILFWNC